jgi:hypothetical protein
VLGVGLGLLSIDGLEAGPELGVALALAAFGYLLVTLTGRPGVTWPAVFGLGAGVVALRAAGVPPVPVLAVAAALLAVAAVAAGSLRSDPLRLLQIPAAWVFGGVALLATFASAEVAGLIVAAGLVAHAGWDAVLRRARPPLVSPSFVEWCCAFDLVVAAGLVAVIT